VARFFAHVRTPSGLIPDGEGFELANIGKLHENAARIAADLVANNPAAADWTFELADEVGRTVLTLPLRDCLRDANPTAATPPKSR
jgi:hypothetical protein